MASTDDVTVRTRVTVADRLGTLESVTVNTPTLAGRIVAGVPTICQVDGSSIRPGGNLPAVSCHV